MLTLDKIYHASYVLKDVVRPTDMIHATNLSDDCDLFLKTENLQVTGAFKARGAYYKISQLSNEERAKGVIACSAGNHAQGVARAAQRYGIKSIICMPNGAPISKVEATKSYGAEVCLVEGTYDDAHDKAVELQKETGATFVHPFDDEMVIAGQGTIGLEILNQLADVDAVIVPIGGGGLISGVAFAIKSLNPKVKVYGVQSAGAPSMYLSIAQKSIQTLPSVNTFADGIAVKTPGELTFELCSQYVDEITTVTDDEVATAILSLFGKFPIKGKKVCCLVSGGNIDVTILSRVIERGLQKTGRLAEFTIALTDKPGELVAVSKIIADLGANVVSVSHDRADLNTDINSCYLRLSMETRNHEHIQRIKDSLAKYGYKIVS